MKRRGGGHSIRESMIKCILCYVLAPLFLALGILCYLVRQFTVRFFTCQKRAKQLLAEGKNGLPGVGHPGL